MEIDNNIILQIINIIFMFFLGYYLIQNLQWYNYNIWRAITKHNKFYWHFIYFIIPIIFFIILGKYFYIYLIIYCITLGRWYYKLDKKLIWTNKVKRFFITYGILLAISFIVLINFYISKYILFIALLLTFTISYISEYAIMRQYEKLAIEKINSMQDLIIIAITASYGKTSIKNFLHALLSKQYNTYATPKSINTINGIIRDINDNLPKDCEIYIVEAGARQKNDIFKIANLINHHYAIIGEIGEAHLQYFKTLENTISAKYELLQSNQLKEIFLYEKNKPPLNNIKITTFPPKITNIESNLNFTKFTLWLDNIPYDFKTKILGKFNIINLSVAILIAHKFNIKPKEIQNLIAELNPIKHRLEKMEVNGKIILDDSFNGNFNGMSEAIRLSSLHSGGKKIIITPGLVESSENNNIKLALLIDKVFDIAIITGELNSKILSSNILNAQKIIIKDKINLNNILATFCKEGDLILFANDAPNYI